MKDKVELLPLDDAKIRQSLDQSVFSKLAILHVADSISSTSDYVFEHLAEVKNGAVVCLAETQTAGRGRNGRRWVSPAQANIYMSLGRFFQGVSPQALSCFSLALGVALCEWLEEKGVSVKLKWPNDILVGHKKLAGLLIESRVKSDGVVLVAGLGLNVAMPDVVRESESEMGIDQPWTDLSRVLGGRDIDRSKLSSELIGLLLDVCETFESVGFSKYAAAWKKFNVLEGRQVTLVEDGGEYTASVMGLNDDCGLKVCSDREERVVYAADIKIKLNADDCN